MINLTARYKPTQIWLPLTMSVVSLSLSIFAFSAGRYSWGSVLLLWFGLNVWRAISAMRQRRLVEGLRKDPELWRLYLERRKHD